MRSTLCIFLLLCSQASAEYVDHIRGTGSASPDNATFAAAVAAANAAGGGRIYIHGNLVLNGTHNFSTPVSIIGVPGSNPTITYTGNSEIGWNRNFAILSQTTKKMSATLDRASAIEVPSGYLSGGDWFIVLSDDDLDGTSPGIGKTNRPCEIHQCKEVRDTNTPQAFTADAGTDYCTSLHHGLANNSVVSISTTGTLPGGLSAGDYWVRDSDFASRSISGHLGAPAVDASTDTFNNTAHGRSDGDIVHLLSSGTLPAPLAAYTPYYIVNSDTNSFQLSLTSGGAAIDLTNTGSGTHAWRFSTQFKLCSTVGGTAINITSTGSGTHSLDGPDYIIFDDIIVDAMNDNPRVYKVAMLSGVVVRDLTLTMTGATDPTLPALNFRTCENVLIDNVKWKNPAPNEALFSYCANCVVTNCRIENKQSYDTGEGYGIIVGTVNRFVFSDSTGQGCRHLFTTSGEGVTNRYGTSRHVLITDITASANGENDSTLPLFDTHGEGWAVIFQNLHITIPTEKGIVKAPFTGNANRAIQTRSRGTVIRNCYIQGSGVSNAILVVGADCKIENCHISNCWRGIRVQNDPDGGTNGDVDRCIIRGNRIINCTGSGVYLDDGTAHLVQGNDFNNCGQGSSGESASAIYIDTTTPDDIQITGNNIPNTGNEFAVGGTVFNPTQVTLSGNNLRGYSSDGTSTDSGFDPASSAAVSLETEATTYNFTD